MSQPTTEAWTLRRVEQAAPDRASVMAARRLSRPGPWSEVGSTEDLLWGKCQGTGRNPYQVSVDLTGPAFRCSCPSRKQPCKHSVALLMLWVRAEGSLAWLDTPGGSSDSAGSSGSGDGPPAFALAGSGAGGGEASERRSGADPVAQSRRREERIALMTGGMEDFALWLQDLIRGGTAAARHQGYAWWDAAAARLVDAQMPGLAEQVRAAGEEVMARPDWSETLLLAVGRWWALTWTWSRRDALDADAVGDLRAALGWAFPTAEIRESEPVEDDWLVLGLHRSDDGRLQQQRTWLWGETRHEIVLVLDFAVLGQPLPTARMVGSVLRALVWRYPGTDPRRALLGEDLELVRSSPGLPAGGDVGDALARAAKVWATSPWPSRIPVVLDDVVVTESAVVDAGQRALPLSADTDPWLLLALTGGQSASLFGELQGGRFRPLTVPADGALVAL